MQIRVGYRVGHERVVLTSMSRGRALALHAHRRGRVRKKYTGAVVMLRHAITKDTIHDVMRNLMAMRALTEKGKRRLCRALCKLGIEARVERQGRATP